MSTCSACGQPLPSNANFCAKCGRPVATASAEDPLLGKTVGNYRILAPLGKGAMGKVYRAEQVNLGRTVCIKTLLPQFTGDATLLQRFEREAKAVSGLHHPNIVGVLDFGRSRDGTLFIAMELVEGPSLRAVIEKEAPLSLRRALTICDQILSALEEAHGAGVVHRDLKPENALVGHLRDGSEMVKVVDFGIAKLLGPEGDGSERLTGTGLVCGTPGYMAPEQIAGDPHDARTDVYAAGVILFELLTGHPPFGAPTLNELLRLHLDAPPPSPSSCAKLPIPPALDLLVLRSLSKKPERRVESALEMMRALETLRLTMGGPSSSTSSAAPLAVRCPQCGRAETSERKFCGECGAPLAGAAAAQAGPAASPSDTAAGQASPAAAGSSVLTGSLDNASLRRLIPTDLVRHLEDLSSLVQGERRHVTVLFADVSGFTAMSETMDPEDVRQVINRCFDGMVQVVNRYDGTVDKFMGDCIMVLFGAPKSHEDDPERAVRCALDIQRSLEEVFRTLSCPLSVRIGVYAGEVLAGGVGGQGRMDYTVIGDTVNVAQRLQSAAAIGKILVSRAVYELTRQAIGYRDLPSITVKNRREPVQPYEVVGLRGEQQLAESDLVGRQAEMATLVSLLAAARKGGKAGAALVLGEPGMGKTRLLKEVATRAAAGGLAVGFARAGRYGSPAPLELVRDAVFSLCGGVPLSPAEADDRLSTLTRLGVALQDLRRIQHLFGTAAAMSGFERDEAQRLDRAALVAVFARACGETGLCLVLDDLQHADPVSLELFSELLSTHPTSRLAIIGAARPGNTDRILTAAARLELRPLSASDVVKVGRTELYGAPLPGEVEKLVAQRSEGNPLYARVVVRSLVETGALKLSAGNWLATSRTTEMALPETLQRMVGARLDGLSAGARALLRQGAVAGLVFPLELVTASLDEGVEIGPAVSECVHKGFLAHSEQAAGALQFTQAVMRETLLHGITKADLKHAHLRIAEALEKGLVGSGAEHPAEQLARHFLAAEQPRKAARYLELAGDRLAERNDFAGAAQRLGKALSLLIGEAARAGAAPSEEAAAKILSLAARTAAAQQMFAPRDAVALLEPALAQVPAAVAISERAEALRQKGLALLKLSRLDEAGAALDEARICAAGHAGPELVTHLFADRAAVLEAKGQLPRAAEELLEGLRAFAGTPAGERDLMWRYLNQLGRIHLRLRQPEKARGFFENARGHASRAGSAVGESRAVANLAATVAALGDPRAALSMLGEALELADKGSDRLGIARLHNNAGRLLISMGELKAAQDRLESAKQLSEELDWPEGIAAASQALEALRARSPAAPPVPANGANPTRRG
ncbi:MAG: protein kinase [Deltaproteobacteria bacterium]|nr:protein kinase [Deltaproteobacteria bacterium]